MKDCFIAKKLYCKQLQVLQLKRTSPASTKHQQEHIDQEKAYKGRFSLLQFYIQIAF